MSPLSGDKAAKNSFYQLCDCADHLHATISRDGGAHPGNQRNIIVQRVRIEPSSVES
jgi:hypothetical protein